MDQILFVNALLIKSSYVVKPWVKEWVTTHHMTEPASMEWQGKEYLLNNGLRHNRLSHSKIYA